MTNTISAKALADFQIDVRIALDDLGQWPTANKGMPSPITVSEVASQQPYEPNQEKALNDLYIIRAKRQAQEVRLEKLGLSLEMLDQKVKGKVSTNPSRKLNYRLYKARKQYIQQWYALYESLLEEESCIEMYIRLTLEKLKYGLRFTSSLSLEDFAAVTTRAKDEWARLRSQQAIWNEEVIRAEILELEGAHHPGGSNKAMRVIGDVSRPDSKDLLLERNKLAERRAEELLAKKDFREYLCAALKTVTGDVFAVANTVAQILGGLVIAGVLSLPLIPILVASIALLVTRVGISTMCSGIE